MSANEIELIGIRQRNCDLGKTSMPIADDDCNNGTCNKAFRSDLNSTNFDDKKHSNSKYHKENEQATETTKEVMFY